MKKAYLLILIALCFAAYADEPAHEPTHEVEEIVFNFIADLKNDLYADHIFFFQSDTELTKEDRQYYFRRLETFVRNNIWDLHFTAVDIYDGYEDIADVILKANSGDVVIFIVAYWYDTERWELDGYEFPGLTYDRPEDQSYEEYVQEIIDIAKDVGEPYSQRHKIDENGTYYIEYK